MDGVTKSKRGGARAGAGRHKLAPDAKKQTITVRLSPDLMDWLDTFGRGRVAEIEKALRAWQKKSRKSA
jgi:uncharacterized protein (DUF4415 family)